MIPRVSRQSSGTCSKLCVVPLVFGAPLLAPIEVEPAVGRDNVMAEQRRAASS
jgi:hypothetical protein